MQPYTSGTNAGQKRHRTETIPPGGENNSVRGHLPRQPRQSNERFANHDRQAKTTHTSLVAQHSQEYMIRCISDFRQHFRENYVKNSGSIEADEVAECQVLGPLDQLKLNYKITVDVSTINIQVLTKMKENIEQIAEEIFCFSSQNPDTKDNALKFVEGIVIDDFENPQDIDSNEKVLSLFKKRCGGEFITLKAKSEEYADKVVESIETIADSVFNEIGPKIGEIEPKIGEKGSNFYTQENGLIALVTCFAIAACFLFGGGGVTKK